jgi:hypothetical protein
MDVVEKNKQKKLFYECPTKSVCDVAYQKKPALAGRRTSRQKEREKGTY